MGEIDYVTEIKSESEARRRPTLTQGEGPQFPNLSCITHRKSSKQASKYRTDASKTCHKCQPKVHK